MQENNKKTNAIRSNPAVTLLAAFGLAAGVICAVNQEEIIDNAKDFYAKTASTIHAATSSEAIMRMALR